MSDTRRLLTAKEVYSMVSKAFYEGMRIPSDEICKHGANPWGESKACKEATKQLKEGWGLKYEPDEKELIDIHNREISELIEQYCK